MKPTTLIVLNGLRALAFFAVCLSLHGCSWIASLPDQFSNTVECCDSENEKTVSMEVKKFHQALFIADLHADSLLWNRDLSKRGDYGHVDVPRLIEGNVAVQAFTVVTEVPLICIFCDHYFDIPPDLIRWLNMAQLRPLDNWFSPKERAITQAGDLKKLAEQNDSFILITNKTKLVNYYKNRKGNETAGFLGLEGGHALEGEIENVEVFYKAGFRMIGLTHFFDNKLAGSATGNKKHGLTDFGRDVLAKMKEKKIILDVSHASAETIDEILTMAPNELPAIVASHVGVEKQCPRDARHLTDKQIKKIHRLKGLIGIGLYQTAVCDEELDGTIEAMAHIKEIAGVESIALGSDFDGTVTTHFDASNMVLMTQGLMERKMKKKNTTTEERVFSDEDIKKIMGENVYSFLSKHLPD